MESRNRSSMAVNAGRKKEATEMNEGHDGFTKTAAR
jgi:hypothetical protein